MPDPDAPPPPSDPWGEPDSVRDDLRFNYAVLLTHGLLGQTGMRLIHAPTFLPRYVTELAGFRGAAGIVRAVQSLGMFLSPFLAVRAIENRPRAKGLTLLYGGAMRAQILLLALIALFVPGPPAFVLVCLVLGLFGLALGMQSVAFSFILSKAIPPERRGRLQGLRNAAAGIGILAVSAVGGVFLDRYGFPTGYGYTFLVAFVLTTLGLIALGFVREPISQGLPSSGSIWSRIQDARPLLAREDQFRRFLVARLLATAALGSTPFYILFIGQRLELSGALLAGLTMAFTGAQSLTVLGWGLLADRNGFRAVFMASVTVWAAGVLLLTLPTLGGAYAVFLLLGAGQGGFRLAAQSLVLEFGDAQNRPLRIATANSSSELAGAAGYLAAALLADRVPLPILFTLAGACQLAALSLIWDVREPRRRVEPFVPFPE